MSLHPTMMYMSFSMTSLRSCASSKSLASFVDELSAATRLAEFASTGAAARSTRRRARPDPSVLPDSFFTDASSSSVVVPVPEIKADSSQRRRVRPESVLPGLLFAKPARVAERHLVNDEDEPETIHVATVGARRRVRPESILPGLLFAKPSQSLTHEIEVENQERTMPESGSTSSIASMSSSKSLTSFKRDLFATGRLGDLIISGFEARAYRRRARAVSAEQPSSTPMPAPKPSVGANAAAKASTMSLSSRPLAERSPFVKYTQSDTLNLSSVRDRSGKWIGASPSLFADIEPAQEFCLRGALLLPGMQFTSSTVGAEKGDVLRSLTGDVANEKVSRVEKLRQVFKRA